MTFIFFFALFILFYEFAGYPTVLFILSWLLGKDVKKNDIEPMVSLIISAYNEEGCIDEKLKNTLALDYPKNKLEIIVASESTDRTHEIVRGYENRGVRLFAHEKREGKRATLFKSVPLARGEIIVFSDANAMYLKDALRKLIRNFHDERIGCVSGRLKYKKPRKTGFAGGETAYWEFDFMLKQMASRLFSLAGCGGVNGSIFAIRKNLYDPIDKFRGDDFEISCRIEIKGGGVVLEPEAVSYEEAAEKSNQEFQRKIRLASWNLRSTLLLLREAAAKKRFLTAYLLLSHRLIRYTTPVWLILILTANLFLCTNGGWWLLVLGVQTLFYAAAVTGWALELRERKIPTVFLAPFYFCVMNAAALLALIKNISQREEHIWEKTR